MVILELIKGIILGIVEGLTEFALEYKIFPILMFLVSILLALTVVFQNITIGVILDKVLIQQQFQLTSLLIIIFFCINCSSSV